MNMPDITNDINMIEILCISLIPHTHAWWDLSSPVVSRAVGIDVR